MFLANISCGYMLAFFMLGLLQYWGFDQAASNILQREGGRERYEVRALPGLHPHEWISNHWTVLSNYFNITETLWSSWLWHKVEICGPFSTVNYQLWMLETTLRLWYRAREHCVHCSSSVWVSNKYWSIMNFPLVCSVAEISQVNHYPSPRTNMDVYVLDISVSKVWDVRPQWENQSETARHRLWWQHA